MRRTGRGNAFFFVPFYAKKRIFAKTGGSGQTYRNLNGKDVSAAGIMIYHDMMYPGHPEHAPANTTDQVHKRTHNHALNFAKTGLQTDDGFVRLPRVRSDQELEVRHNVRQLAHHPSIVIWDGQNSDDWNPKVQVKNKSIPQSESFQFAPVFGSVDDIDLVLGAGHHDVGRSGGAENTFLDPFSILKTVNLPRQARDKQTGKQLRKKAFSAHRTNRVPSGRLVSPQAGSAVQIHIRGDHFSRWYRWYRGHRCQGLTASGPADSAQ